MKEIWRDVRGYEGKYAVSNSGRVKSLARINTAGRRVRERHLVLVKQPNGYLRVSLSVGNKIKNKSVHRLVLSAFIGPGGSGMQARHLNGKKNDNRLENLAWGTPQENQADRIAHGTYLYGESAPGSKLTDAAVRSIFCNREKGLSQRAIGKLFGVDKTTIARVLSRECWGHVNLDIVL